MVLLYSGFRTYQGTTYKMEEWYPIDDGVDIALEAVQDIVGILKDFVYNGHTDIDVHIRTDGQLKDAEDICFSGDEYKALDVLDKILDGILFDEGVNIRLRLSDVR